MVVNSGTNMMTITTKLKTFTNCRKEFLKMSYFVLETTTVAHLKLAILNRDKIIMSVIDA